MKRGRMGSTAVDMTQGTPWKQILRFALPLLYGDNVFEKRGIRRDRTGGSGKGRYLQGKTGILKRDGPASASVSLKMFEREGVDVVGVLFFAPRAAESPQEPRAASGACDIGKPPKA